MTPAGEAPGTIAIVGAGCRYPDAAGPERLWETVLAGRRAFRPIPPERLDLGDYGGGGPDSTYVRSAAVLEDWTFDRAAHRVPGAAYRVTDPTHWLALEVAAETLAAAGFPQGRGLDGERAGVVLGNTLTGEFSRASLLRLRWPYVRRVVQDALTAEGWAGRDLGGLMARLERRFKEPFPEPTDETLVGGLANAIAGRVCNHFDLRGGGYTVDGACSSSLLAVTAACAALVDGDLDFALAGGVDLSLDPFELVGFARIGALATSAMRIYDARATGFLPGEGCGMVALMRAGDAVAAGHRPLALIRGWGVSSDGRGGLTRPERAGQMLAMRRAYARAGFGPETVALFEGHGTGTEVGDRTEIGALIEVQGGRRRLPPAALGSVKANIGHTKAAAGAAGLIKAALALHHQVVPPTVGCVDAHESLRGSGTPLRIVREAAPWPDAPMRAGVSAVGFGGINTHVVLEAAVPRRARGLSVRERRLARRSLDAEVFAFTADTPADLAAALERAAARADGMSEAEHIDMAAALAESGAHAAPPFRAAVVAGDPGELARRARRAAALLGGSDWPGLVAGPGVYLGRGAAGRVGLLFPGQGAPVRTGAGALGVLLPDLGGPPIGAPAGEGGAGTAVAQPAVFRTSMAGLHWLARIGVDAVAAAGHSLGEITALCWAGALAEDAALDLVTARGRIMAETGAPGTGMVSLAAPPAAVAELIAGTGLVIAADNGAAQVAAGPLAAVEEVLGRARRAGVAARRLDVSHAFHTPAVAAARPEFARLLRGVRTGPLRRRVHSTVTGAVLAADHDLRGLLADQITGPVRFRAALEALADGCDLLVECGPGQTLTALAAAVTGVPVIALDAGAESAEPVARATGALFAAGAVGDLKALFAERFHRPFDLERPPRFLANPCESAPRLPAEPEHAAPAAAHGTAREEPEDDGPGVGTGVDPGIRTGDALDVVRALVAEVLELPVEMVGDHDALLGDLHLNSLRSTQLAVEAAVRFGRAVPSAPPPLATATVADLAAVVAALPEAERSAGPGGGVPAGVAEWHRVLTGVPSPVRPDGQRPPRDWRISGEGPLRSAVEPLLDVAAGAPPAMVVFLPEDPDDRAAEWLVGAASSAVGSGVPLTVVDLGDTAPGFVGTLAQEHPGLDFRWIGVASARSAAATAAALAGTWRGHAEIVIDAAGRTCETTYRPAPSRPDGPPLAPGDVLLVTGGARGIGLETAAFLGERWGVRLALVGRGEPAHDAGLRANLARLDGAGTAFQYESADVTDPAAVRAAIGRFTARLGPVRGVVHGSAVNRPARFTDLDAADFAEHAAPKHHGLRTLLGALDRGALRLLITHGSVIGRFGLPGEAHYALANGRQRELARVLARELPRCRVRNVDWTAWSGAGMGERLDVLDALTSAGVTPLPVEAGVRLLAEIAESAAGGPTVLATGRLPQLDDAARETTVQETAAQETTGVPVRVRTRTPGVELVIETGLSLRDAPHLADHRIDGMVVLPAVSALEMMAEAAVMLTGERRAGIADGRFDRPVIVPEEGARTLRVCALAEEGGGVRIVLRSDETDFAVDHFSGTVTGAGEPPKVPRRHGGVPPHDGRTLYGPTFFHGPCFQRLLRYEHLDATSCTALLSGDRPEGPAGAVLGDVARNDASVHVLQACVPHRRLLPVGCDHFAVHGDHDGGGGLVLDAVERSHDGDDYTYDVVLGDGAGEPLLSWTGLRLRDTGPLQLAPRLEPVLVGPYLQGSLRALLPGANLRLTVNYAGATGPAAEPGWNRDDAGGFAVAVSPGGLVACDRVTDRADDARTALADRLGKLTDEPGAHVRSRLRTVQECLSKAGRGSPESLTVQGVYENGWVVLRAGAHEVVSVVLTIGGLDGPIALAVAVEGRT
ncbi:type I polyketide synthase [Actinomadura xylanilytica]|uniref:type I polyketide synthase n=1 Tax=Actinomadura xylanilytica TaxID=887459 RepID=UPI00255ABA7C|nr:type I polyketide synthase [Actinomadura xylanilytica]MDL4776724.1 SDR family NAD(P)-dependent oxidoreductase [Actinomadura xylanilytica]